MAEISENLFLFVEANADKVFGEEHEFFCFHIQFLDPSFGGLRILSRTSNVYMIVIFFIEV